MVSDILCEAINDIQEYQRDSPGCYDGIARELTAVVGVMNATLEFLDAIPPRPVTLRKHLASVGLSIPD